MNSHFMEQFSSLNVSFCKYSYLHNIFSHINCNDPFLSVLYTISKRFLFSVKWNEEMLKYLYESGPFMLDCTVLNGFTLSEYNNGL